MLFNFTLTPLADVSYWGETEEKHLHWYGLTDGQFWIQAGNDVLLEYSEAVQKNSVSLSIAMTSLLVSTKTYLEFSRKSLILCRNRLPHTFLAKADVHGIKRWILGWTTTPSTWTRVTIGRSQILQIHGSGIAIYIQATLHPQQIFACGRISPTFT